MNSLYNGVCADISLIAHIFPIGQLAKYLRILYVKPRNKVYFITCLTFISLGG